MVMTPRPWYDGATDGWCRQEHDLVAIGTQECSYKEHASAAATHQHMGPASSLGMHASACGNASRWRAIPVIGIRIRRRRRGARCRAFFGVRATTNHLP